jgi:hypothetical protein
MPYNYPGLPAASTVEQSIVLAQLLILRDLERRAQQLQSDGRAADRPHQPDRKAA